MNRSSLRILLAAFTLIVFALGLLPPASAQENTPVPTPFPPPGTPSEAGSPEPAIDQGSPAKPEAAARPGLVGTLTAIWGDPEPGSPAQGQFITILTTDSGERIELSTSDQVLAAAGGITALHGKRVTVEVFAEQLGTNRQGMSILEARGITLLSTDSPRISGSQPWVSILCKFADVSAEPRSLTYFRNMYGSSSPGLNHYWKEQSYDRINLDGSTAFGWFTLPQPRSYYVQGEDTDLGRLVDDCTAAANASVYFPNYIGINMMFNESLGCCAWGGGWWLSLDGVSRAWRVTWEPPWGYENMAIMAHETGHGFGLPHSSGQYGETYDNRWDVMSDSWSNCEIVFNETYGCIGQGTISHHKEILGWIDPDKIYTAAPGETATIKIERLAQPTSNHYLMAIVPIRDSNRYYTVETRMRVGYDYALPGFSFGGVIIHEVDRTRDNEAQVIDIDNNGDTGDEGAKWTRGETFYGEGGIEISVVYLSDDGSYSYTVTIDGGEPGSDPYEPNNSTATATSISYDTGINALIQQAGDIDYYKFNGTSGDRVVVDVDARVNGSPLDSTLAILSSSGSELAFNDDYNGGRDSYLEYILPTSGAYFIKITDYSSSSGGLDYFYDLWLDAYGQPTITGFDPSRGSIGESVTINGTNFIGATSVKFSGTAAEFTVDSATKITAIVPSGARTGKITVTTPSGTATSSGNFTVTTPDLVPFTPSGYDYPVVLSSIKGTTTTGPLYAGKPLFFDWRFKNIGNGTAIGDFTVQVTINGTEYLKYPFSDFAAGYDSGIDDWLTSHPRAGCQTVRMVVDPDNLIAESNENNNTWQRDFCWQEVTGWWAEFFNNRDLSGDPVLVRDDPRIEFDWADASPGSGVANDNFSARWTRTINFAGGDYRFTAKRDDGLRLFIDGQEVFSRWSYGVEEFTVDRRISAGQHELRLEMYEIDGWAKAHLSWELLSSPTPTITGFSPTKGPAGTAVTINGTNLSGATSVRFNGATATITANSATQITAIVPAGAKTGKVTVTTPGGSATTTYNFTVTKPPKPTVSGFSQSSAMAYSTIRIYGTNFTNASKVTFTKNKVAVPTVLSANELEVVVPFGAVSGKVSVTTPGGTGASKSKLTVIVPPTVSKFTPSSARVGSKVTITGKDFVVGATAVRFGNINANAVVINSATKITVYVPAGLAPGNRVRIYVTNEAGTGMSKTDFIVK